MNGADRLAEKDRVAVGVGDEESAVAEGRIFEVSQHLNARLLQPRSNFQQAGHFEVHHEAAATVVDASTVVLGLLEQQNLHLAGANGRETVAVEFSDAEHRETELVMIEQQRGVDALDIQYQVREQAFHLAIHFLCARYDSF